MHFAIVSKYTVQSFLVIYVTKNYFKILNICWWTLKRFQTEATSMCRYQWGLVTSKIFTDEFLSMPPIWSPPIHPPGTCTCVYVHLCTLNICVCTFIFFYVLLAFFSDANHLNQNQCEAFSRNKLFPPPPPYNKFFSALNESSEQQFRQHIFVCRVRKNCPNSQKYCPNRQKYKLEANLS